MVGGGIANVALAGRGGMVLHAAGARPASRQNTQNAPALARWKTMQGGGECVDDCQGINI